MAFGFSVGDIFKTIEVADRIYEKCFTKANGADVQYLQFGKEIKSLSENLSRLRKIFEDHIQVPQWRGHGHDHDIGIAISELTGDFQKTLDDCDKLLSDQSRFRRNKAGFVDNVRWWLGGTETQVKSLRERVHFHSTKIIFITKPVELKLLFEIKGAVDGLGALWAAQVGPGAGSAQAGPAPGPVPERLPFIPQHLESRFVNTLRCNTPASYQRLEDFPLKEGWDALVSHWQESTVNFVPGQYQNQKIPDETQYLNLVKCTWILHAITESSRFREMGPNSLWARSIREAEESIVNEYRRIRLGQLIPPEDDAISRLPEACFSIWMVDHDTVGLPVLADERISEEKILELVLPNPLGTRTSTLTIFRKSDNEMRIVCTTTDEQNEAFRESEGYKVNTDSTRFIPVYAVPKSRDSTVTNNVIFCNSQGQSEMEYSLGCRNDVVKFQRAMLGYKVNLDTANVVWSTYSRSFRFGKAEELGNGRIQIWQAKPFPRISSTPEKPSSPTSSSYIQSQASSLATTKLTLVASGNASEISGRGGTGLAFSSPELPVLMVYTMYNKKYTFLHLRLDREVFINDKACDCRKAGKSCRRVVIESKDKLDLKRFCARDESEKGLNTWDLARFRSPRHPSFRDLEKLSKTKYLCLEFSDMSERVEFQEKFSLVEDLRDLDYKEYHNTLSRLGRRADYCDRPKTNASGQS